MTQQDPLLEDVARRTEERLDLDKVVVVAHDEDNQRIFFGSTRGPRELLTDYIGMIETIKHSWLYYIWNNQPETPDQPPER